MTHSWMPFVRRAGLILGLLLAACSSERTKPLTPCNSSADCKEGEECSNGLCVHTGPVCVADELTCDGNKVVKCKSDRSGFEEQTICATACVNGQCSSNACTAGEQRCDGDNIMRCAADLSKFEAISVCDLGCDPETVSCRAGTCRPGARRCTLDGQLETCDSRGAEWTKTSCDAGGPGRCTTNGLSGTAEIAWCEKLSCTPGAQRCNGLDVLECTEQGAGEKLLTTCASGCENAICVASSCKPTDVRCSLDGKYLERCNDLGTGYNTQPCSEDGVGVCIAVPGMTGSQAARCARGLCSANSVRCENDKRYQCGGDGLSETVVESCLYGCGANGTCAPPACATGEQRCNNGAIEQCRPDRRGFAFQQFCTTGCLMNSGGAARCGSAVCTPLISRCAPGGTSLERCRADGSGFDPEACGNGEVCENGACVTPQPACVPDAVRCNGPDVEKCVSVNGAPYGYQKLGACLGQCSNSSCDAAGECSAFGIRPQLVTEGASLPADGQSTFLFVSDALVGPSGQPVPEGTLVTVTMDAMSGSNPPAFLSNDADPTQPGLQLRVVDGRVDFLVRAPLLPGGGRLTTTVRAQISNRSACSGTKAITFDSSVTDRYVGEDFSTTRARDSLNAAAKWDTNRGVLTLDGFDAGDGRDGDLIVSDGEVIDLTTRLSNNRAFPDMASTRVLAINGLRVTVDGSLSAFEQVGTRVLLINLMGATNKVTSVGAYQFATVAGIQGTDVILSSPVTRRFGIGGNSTQDLATQTVRLIRVPQYNRVQIAGTVTAAAFNGASGGVLAFFAASSAPASAGGNRIWGDGLITMRGRGYRGAAQPASGTVGLSGEGLEGAWNTNSPVGGEGVSGGGYCCGDGDIIPQVMPSTDENFSLAPGTPAGTDIVTRKYFGSGGSYASKGSSTCTYGAGSSYGDALLTDLFMGGGSGSVNQSSARTCFTKRACCRYTESGKYGQCCMSKDAACQTCVTTEYCDAKSYLWDGAFAGQPGGGIILITAASLTITDNGLIDAGGVNSAAGNFGSAGGSVYLRAQNLSLGGPGHVSAAGGLGGGAGRIRFDAVSIDTSYTASWTTPLATFVPQAPMETRSTVVLNLGTPPPGYSTAAAILFPDGPLTEGIGGFDVPSLFAQSNLRFALSQDNGASWSAASAEGATFGGNGHGQLGSPVRWRLTPMMGGGATRGLAAKFLRN